MKSWMVGTSTTLAALALLAMPALSHHSFAMYDQGKVETLTGTMKQFVGQANHAELHFLLIAPDRKGYVKDKDGKPVEWGVELAGAAAVARQGITAEAFPAGTVFSVRLNPLRDGGHYGSKVGAIAKCPVDPATKKAKLPAPEKHCDSVEGMTLISGNAF
jgi:hypothetical protein